MSAALSRRVYASSKKILQSEVALINEYITFQSCTASTTPAKTSYAILLNCPIHWHTTHIEMHCNQEAAEPAKVASEVKLFSKSAWMNTVTRHSWYPADLRDKEAAASGWATAAPSLLLHRPVHCLQLMPSRPCQHQPGLAEASRGAEPGLAPCSSEKKECLST